MSFSEFFVYYVLSRLLYENLPWLLGVVLVVAGYVIHRYGSSLMGQVWGDRDLDGKRDDE